MSSGGPQSFRYLSGVAEGYSIDRTVPLVAQNPARADAGDGVADQAQIFQSSRDINHRVLRHWTPSPFSSPKKRTRCDYEAEDALEGEDEGGDMDIDSREADPQLTPAEAHSRRPIKPLRRTLFADTSIISKPPTSQNQTLGAHHDGSRSENPFIE